RGARHGTPRPRPLAAGPGGVRRVTHLIQATGLAILAYFLALNSFYALLLVLSIPEIWEQNRLAEDEDFQRLMQSDALPPITILVPAHNESATIETSVTAILTLEYRSFEVVEYLRAFLFGRLGWNRLGGSLVISGAFGLFRKQYLHAIGGYRVSSVVEDLDLVVRLHRHLRQRHIAYEIPFIPDPVAWTEV